MNNKLIPLIMTLVVGIILAGSLLMPVLSDAQKDLGNPITLTNDSAIVLREVADGDVLEVERTVISSGTYSDKWFLNDAEVTTLTSTALTWNVGLISDAAYIQTFGPTSGAAASFYLMGDVTPTLKNVCTANSLTAGDVITSSFTFENGTLTASIVTNTTTTEYTAPYTWGYVVCPKADGQYYSAETLGAGICKSADELILCGAYTTGDFDTMYAYRNGTTYTSNDAYTMSVAAPLTLHEGTTDIYDIAVTVSMSDGTDAEEFTPYRIFLPYEVSGHATAGATYSLLGAIPILVIVALLVGAIGMIAVRRND